MMCVSRGGTYLLAAGEQGLGLDGEGGSITGSTILLLGVSSTGASIISSGEFSTGFDIISLGESSYGSAVLPMGKSSTGSSILSYGTSFTSGVSVLPPSSGSGCPSVLGVKGSASTKRASMRYLVISTYY